MLKPQFILVLRHQGNGMVQAICPGAVIYCLNRFWKKCLNGIWKIINAVQKSLFLCVPKQLFITVHEAHQLFPPARFHQNSGTPSCLRLHLLHCFDKLKTVGWHQTISIITFYVQHICRSTTRCRLCIWIWLWFLSRVMAGYTWK